jgi:uncharacterized protein with LGFP repeats
MVDHLIWSSVVPGLDLNPEAAIYRLWRSYRDQGNYLGVPLSPEQQVSDTEVQQPFSSGAVIAWNPVDGARLV